MVSLDAFEHKHGARLRALRYTYGSERRRGDCIAWITDAEQVAKSIGYGDTEAAARFSAICELNL